MYYYTNKYTLHSCNPNIYPVLYLLLKVYIIHFCVIIRNFTNHFYKSYYVAETSTQETKHHTQRVGELRFIMLAGPEELTLQALSPEQRGYRVFIDLI